MLAGERLYSASGGSETARRILKEPPPDIGEERPETPAALVSLMFELLAKDRAQRPSDATKVATRLDEITAGLMALEGPVDVAEWASETAGERRTKQEAMLAEALSTAEAPPVGPAAIVSAARGGRGWLVGAAVLVVVLGLAAVGAALYPGWTSPGRSSVEPPPGAAAERVVEPAPSMDDEATAPENEASSDGLAEPPTAAEDVAEERAEVERRSAGRSRRRHGGRMRERPMATTGASGDEAMMSGGDGWDAWDSN